MNKELVDPLAHNKFQYDPADADYAWVAKVMLLASPSRDDLIAKTCYLAGMYGFGYGTVGSSGSGPLTAGSGSCKSELIALI